MCKACYNRIGNTVLINCSMCSKILPHYAKQMCRSCYSSYGRTINTCVLCGKVSPSHGKGLCGKCFRKELTKTKRLKSYEILGNQCRYCEESRQDLLCIDHIDNSGANFRHINKGTDSVYNLVISDNKVDNLQLLCINCNELKELVRIFSITQRISEKIRRDTVKCKAVNKLGGKCAWCGEKNLYLLTVDHINNDGAKYRRENPGSKGGTMYAKIAHDKIDVSDLQLLCYACNISKRINHKSSYSYMENEHKDKNRWFSFGSDNRNDYKESLKLQDFLINIECN